MLRDITLGQYYPVDSPIHRLDPRTKLIGTLTFIISLFLFKSIAGYLVATAFLVTVIRLSKVPFKFMVRGLKAILLILIILLLLVEGDNMDLVITLGLLLLLGLADDRKEEKQGG